MVKSGNNVKSACFCHVLRHNSAIFEDIDLKFLYTFFLVIPIYQLLTYIPSFKEKKKFRGNILKKEKILTILKIFEIFKSEIAVF